MWLLRNAVRRASSNIRHSSGLSGNGPEEYTNNHQATPLLEALGLSTALVLGYQLSEPLCRRAERDYEKELAEKKQREKENPPTPACSFSKYKYLQNVWDHVAYTQPDLRTGVLPNQNKPKKQVTAQMMIDKAMQELQLIQDRAVRDSEYSAGKEWEKEENLSEAINCYTIASKFGHSDAKYRLGKLQLKSGNRDQALSLFKEAADLGHTRADTKLQNLISPSFDIHATPVGVEALKKSQSISVLNSSVKQPEDGYFSTNASPDINNIKFW